MEEGRLLSPGLLKKAHQFHGIQIPLVPTSSLLGSSTMQLIAIFYFMIACPITHPLPFPQMTGHRGSTRRALLLQSPSTSSKRIMIMCYDRFSLLVGRQPEQKWFVGWRDLDYSTPRVWWLCTPLRGKAKAQGTRPSRPEKKGACPIGNSRGIAARVGRLLLGSGKALDTFLCPLHESGLVEGERM